MSGRSRRSTLKIRLLVLALPFLFPANAAGQTFLGAVDLEVAGVASRYSYRWDSEEWRPAVSGQARLLISKWVHLEAGLGKAWTRTSMACPAMGSCPSSLSSATISSHWAVGLQVPFRRWVPFLGFGTGHLSNDFEDSGTHVQYYGLQRRLSRWFSVMAEFRRTRFRWYEDHKVWNKEWGVGLVLRIF